MSQEAEIGMNDKSLRCPWLQINSQFFSITSVSSSLSLFNPLVNHIKKYSQYIYLQLESGYPRYFEGAKKSCFWKIVV